MIPCVCFRCRQCSEAAVREPSAEGVKLIDEKIIAEGESEFCCREMLSTAAATILILFRFSP